MGPLLRCCWGSQAQLVVRMQPLVRSRSRARALLLHCLHPVCLVSSAPNTKVAPQGGLWLSREHTAHQRSAPLQLACGTAFSNVSCSEVFILLQTRPPPLAPGLLPARFLCERAHGD